MIRISLVEFEGTYASYPTLTCVSNSVAVFMNLVIYD